MILLCSLLAMLVVRPIFGELAQLTWMVPLFVTGVLLASVWAVARRRNQVLILAVIVLVVLSDHWIVLTSEPWLHPAVSPLLSLLFFAWIAIILAVDVFSRTDAVNADLIYGGINIYLLIGLGFADAHQAIAVLVPGAINGLDGKEMADAVYYSFVTLTTLGYGDITPSSEGARMLAYLEALIGQLYVAVLLAQLVALRMSARQ